MDTLHRGYAEGLSGYREWLYPQLTPGDEAEKRKVYFSPEEIAALEEIRHSDPERFERYRWHPPQSLEEIITNP